jgi:hypothetical protein
LKDLWYVSKIVISDSIFVSPKPRDFGSGFNRIDILQTTNIVKQKKKKNRFDEESSGKVDDWSEVWDEIEDFVEYWCEISVSSWNKDMYGYINDSRKLFKRLISFSNLIWRNGKRSKVQWYQNST